MRAISLCCLLWVLFQGPARGLLVRSAARAVIVLIILRRGCAPPSRRRAIRTASSTSSRPREIVEVALAPGALVRKVLILSVISLPPPRTRRATA